jgi:transposase-like protein
MPSVHCPYCGESIEIWVDPGGPERQRYVEDCSVCCRPISLSIAGDGEGDYNIVAESEDD